jgi:heterodisulfide reductase subunit D
MAQKININEYEYTSLFKCTRCGQCIYGKEESEFTPLCPVNKKGHFFSYSAGGMMQIVRNLYEGKIDYSETLKDIVYHCTTCGVCEVNCGVIENHLDIIGRLRRDLITMDFPESKALSQIVANIDEHKNPYGHPHKNRTGWIGDRASPRNNETASVFYYTGCVSAFDQKTIPQALAGIWEKMGIAFAVSDDEWCCGGPLFYSGYEEKAVELARHNVAVIHKAGIKTIVASCPTCALMFKHYYPKWLKQEVPFEVLHSTEYLERLIQKGVLSPGTLSRKANLIYHDSCHLGRGLKLYDAPRNLLRSIGGVTVNEFDLCRENSQCCGGGGMIPVLNTQFSFETAKERLKQIDRQLVDTLASACPNCRKTLHLTVRKNRYKLEVVDVCELVYESLA